MPRKVSRKRLRTLYLVGWALALTGAGEGLVGLVTVGASSDALGELVWLIAMGLVGAGGTCMVIAQSIARRQAARESGRKRLNGWKVLAYIFGDEPFS